MPALVAGAGAPDGTRIEDKGHAVAVHTRQAADPQAALDRLRGPLAGLAARHGLAVEPGRMVIELRPQGGQGPGAAHPGSAAPAVRGHVLRRRPGGRGGFRRRRALRGEGVPGLTVFSGSAEVTALAESADLVVDGPDGVVALLGFLGAAAARPSGA